ncbi:MAG TPA: sulfite exporter TauE/SafE family protein [bacterium]|jgi:hypothetical protein|nr:sulfite exporter TauE/SafE family protein [bacterium]HQL62595.1 sulfite exporter TauE/SafE family protein [bacterium]
MHFPVSGVDTPIWLPPLVAMVISYFTSMAGVSGAFLILPFQMSVLGFISPAVSGTNLVYNVVAIPSGIYRYFREGRLVWPLTWMVVAGTGPGVIVGGIIRLSCLPDPKPFKVFVGCVLLYIAVRLLPDVLKARATQQADVSNNRANWRVEIRDFTWRQIAFEFQDHTYRCGSAGIFMLSLIVGVIGGIYGIGGGAIIAPFFVAIYGLPVHAVAGAALMGTFVTSVLGVVFYEAAGVFYQSTGMAVTPDWLLGGLFGLGGVVGMYFGAKTQRFVPARWLKVMLTVILFYVAVRYIGEYFGVF